MMMKRMRLNTLVILIKKSIRWPLSDTSRGKPIPDSGRTAARAGLAKAEIAIAADVSLVRSFIAKRSPLVLALTRSSAPGFHAVHDAQNHSRDCEGNRNHRRQDRRAVQTQPVPSGARRTGQGRIRKEEGNRTQTGGQDLRPPGAIHRINLPPA